MSRAPAEAAGASAALVSEEWYATHQGEKLIVVPDPLEAMRALARAARTRSKAFIVAVTGSAGKTTTKEAIRTVLSEAGLTHYSIKSFNNHWGVPLMLARLPREAKYGSFGVTGWARNSSSRPESSSAAVAPFTNRTPSAANISGTRTSYRPPRR